MPCHGKSSIDICFWNMFAWKSGEGYEFQKEPWHLGQCFKAHRLRSTLCQSKMAVEKSPGPWFSQLWTSLNFHVLPFSSGTTGTYHYIIIYNITITAYSYIYIFLFTYNTIIDHLILSHQTWSCPLQKETFGRGRSAAQRLLELAGFAQNGEGVVALPATRQRVVTDVSGAG